MERFFKGVLPADTAEALTPEQRRAAELMGWMMPMAGAMPPPWRLPGGIVSASTQTVAGPSSTADVVALNVPIPANGLIGSGVSFFGQSYVALLWGNTDNDVAGQTSNVWMKINGVKIANLSWASAASAQTNMAWFAVLSMTCRATGSGTNGKVIGAGFGYSTAPAFGAGSFAIADNTATTSLDTTIAQTLSVGINNGTSSASDVMRVDHAHVMMMSSGL